MRTIDYLMGSAFSDQLAGELEELRAFQKAVGLELEALEHMLIAMREVKKGLDRHAEIFVVRLEIVRQSEKQLEAYNPAAPPTVYPHLAVVKGGDAA
jgi:hypothetical protein